MQGGNSATSAVETVKEAAANVGASAWAGKEKTKAVVQETVHKATAHDPAARASAEARKQERIHEVEAVKQDAIRHNAAAKELATAATYHPTTDHGHGAAAVVDRPDATEAHGAAGTVEGASTEAVTDTARDDVPRSGNGGAMPQGRRVGKSNDYLPARGTAIGRSSA